MGFLFLGLLALAILALLLGSRKQGAYTGYWIPEQRSHPRGTYLISPARYVVEVSDEFDETEGAVCDYHSEPVSRGVPKQAASDAAGHPPNIFSRHFHSRSGVGEFRGKWYTLDRFRGRMRKMVEGRDPDSGRGTKLPGRFRQHPPR